MTEDFTRAEPVVTYKVTDRTGALRTQGVAEDVARALADRLSEDPGVAPLRIERVTVVMLRREELVGTISARAPQ